MGNTPESKVRDPVVSWAKSQGIYHVRMAFRPGVRAGIPDDLFLLPGGLPIFMEFKRPGKEPTPLQLERIAKLRATGFIAVWSSNATDAKAFLAHALAGEEVR